jgi:hypothetical protein
MAKITKTEVRETTITLVLSDEEQDLLKHMLGYDETIPETVFRLDTTSKTKLSTLMGEIHSWLTYSKGD